MLAVFHFDFGYSDGLPLGGGLERLAGGNQVSFFTTGAWDTDVSGVRAVLRFHFYLSVGIWGRGVKPVLCEWKP